MKNQFLSQAKSRLCETYGEATGQAITEGAHRRYEELCAENPEEPKAVQAHTRAKIYPAIALAEAMVAQEIPRDEAIDFVKGHAAFRAQIFAKILRTMLKIPGLYKKVPRFGEKMTKKSFGTDANFRATYYDTPTTLMRIDMTQCPYFDTCNQYGYGELTTAFCRGDDIVYGNMHPKLTWGRTKTLGDGDECCNFRIEIAK